MMPPGKLIAAGCCFVGAAAYLMKPKPSRPLSIGDDSGKLGETYSKRASRGDWFKSFDPRNFTEERSIRQTTVNVQGSLRR